MFKLQHADPLPSLNDTLTFPSGNLPDPNECLIVYFWSVSCPACLETIHTLREFTNSHGRDRVDVIAIHMPRSERETDLEFLRERIDSLNLDYYILIDNEHKVGERFGVDGWPFYFVFDRERRLRFRSKGEFGFKMAQRSIERMLGVEASASSELSAEARS